MAEKFKILKKLGAGAFAATYLAEVRDKKLRKDWGDKVVIKKPHDKDKEKVLVNELIMNASLHKILLNVQESSSTNIARYLGYEFLDGLYVMVMEHVDGKSLRNILGGVGSQCPLEIEKALDISEQVCEGLIEIHKYRIFHRDIKPENILICDKDQSVKILDLGISRFLHSGDLAMTSAGSPYYTPKEIIIGEGGSFYSDVYSLGVAMYEMITGELPYKGRTIYELEEKILRSSPKNPREINPNIDEKISKIIMKAIEREPNNRYQTADSLLKAIKSFKDGKDEDEDEINKCIFETQEFFISGKFKTSEVEIKLKELINKYPQNPRTYIGLGEFYNRCQKYQDAIKNFSKAIELNSKFAMAFRDKALSLYMIGKQNDAIKNMRTALKLGLEKSIEKHALKIMELWEKENKRL